MNELLNDWTAYLVLAAAFTGTLMVISKRLRKITVAVYHGIVWAIRAGKALPVLLEIQTELAGDDNGNLSLRDFVAEQIEPLVTKLDEVLDLMRPTE